jgi:sortase (surface protein transpeptidase)
LPILTGGILARHGHTPQPQSSIVDQKPQPKPIELAKPISFDRSEPTRLRIPGVGIDTALVAISRSADGTLQVPSLPDRAGWYTDAPTPGELGPAIIDGHVDSVNGPAVFWRLRDVQPGDIIEVDRADFKTLQFKVDAVKQYPQDQLPTQEIYGNVAYAGIRLITCSGTFDTTARSYSDNTVVFGSLIP